MNLTVENIGFLLLVAVVVALLARRLHLPYTVGLVLAGSALAFMPFPHTLILTREIIFTLFLPPLIFEAAIHMRWRDIWRDFSVITLLATLGVLISACIVTLAMYALAGWSLENAGLFGVLISATDPVSVIATFKEAKVKGRLLMLVEAESLFNDGTVAVIFICLLSVIDSNGAIEIGMITQHFIFTIAGGVITGIITGWLALHLSNATSDPLVVVTISTVAAYGSFLGAEYIHVSGVIAALAAGIIIGNSRVFEKRRAKLSDFWEYVTFFINSLVFLLTGLSLAHYTLLPYWKEITTAIVFMLAGRAAAVYACCACFAFSRYKVSRSHQHILFWGGLRGALALALALGLPESVAARGEIRAVTFAVVAFSIVIQGITITPLLKKLGEIKH